MFITSKLFSQAAIPVLLQNLLQLRNVKPENVRNLEKQLKKNIATMLQVDDAALQQRHWYVMKKQNKNNGWKYQHYFELISSKSKKNVVRWMSRAGNKTFLTLKISTLNL